MAALFALLPLLASLTLVDAAPFNVTVDDQFGSLPRIGANISYSEGWFGDGFSNCGQCRPPFRQAVNGTWTSSTYIPKEASDNPKTATLLFNGTAVYVNCIIGPSTVAGVIGNVDITFSVDGLVAGTHVEPAPQQYIYLTAFKREGLSPGPHTLTIQNGRQNGQFDQVMMFLDSVIYTTDDSLIQESRPSPSATPPNQPTQSSGQQQSSGNNRVERNTLIIAAVCSSIGGFALGLLAFWVSSRAIRSRSTSSVPPPTPYHEYSPSPPEPKVSPSLSPPNSAAVRSPIGASSASGSSHRLSTVIDIQRTATRQSVGQTTDLESPNGPPPSYYNDRRS